MLFAVIVLVAVLLLVAIHRYLWVRLVRDTTAPGSGPRRAGTAAAVVLPIVALGALMSGRVGAPFAVERALAWPGYLWLALVLYLTLALAVGEAVRGVWLRILRRRSGEARTGPRTEADEDEDEALVPAAPTDLDDASASAAAGEPSPVTGQSSVVAGEPSPVTGQSSVVAGEPSPATGQSSPAARESHDAAEPVPTEPPAPAAPAPDTTEPAPLHPSRRLFVARSVAAGAAAVATATVGYGTYSVLRGPSLKRVTVPLAKLPRRAHGFRIAVVSDIHLGPILGRDHTERIVATINRTSPDLVAIVGDLVDGSVADLGPAAEPLRRLRSRFGSYFVTGNHEYYSGAAEWVNHVRELGVHPLENARTELPAFDLAGVNDISGTTHHAGPDYGLALGDRDPSRASVLLAHQPVMIHEAVRHGVDLQLSGHTHGGQMWPVTYIAEATNPTVAGLERYGDTQLYVTRGAGAWGPPVRVGAPPDVTLVQLASIDA
ncbi:metallophosphoesterase [Streptomyces sp. NPDC003077]|uniref:metallophosphoesterase n=1 Tax=Streptomyces sp. NPDC003077 TaxID=3154443 RepID=UPI0033A249A9